MNLLLAAVLVVSDAATLEKNIEAARTASKPVTIELRGVIYFLDRANSNLFWRTDRKPLEFPCRQNRFPTV